MVVFHIGKNTFCCGPRLDRPVQGAESMRVLSGIAFISAWYVATGKPVGTKAVGRNERASPEYDEHKQLLEQKTVEETAHKHGKYTASELDSRFIGSARAPVNRKRRIHSDLAIHSTARGFEYSLNLANEYELIDPSRITLMSDRIEVEVGYPNEYNFTDISPLTIANDDIVTISFKSSNPYYGDWIGAYRFGSYVYTYNSEP